MQIALFGGTFDPPRCGHTQVTIELLEQNIVDQVWLVPVKIHNFQKQMSREEIRLQLLQKMCASLPTQLQQQVKIETYELEQTEVSYSYNTLCALQKKYPEHHFQFVIGSDNVAKFSKWYKAEELLQQFEVLIYPRKGFVAEPLLPGMKLLQNMPEVEVSSTQIRHLIQDHADKPTYQLPAGLVAPAVEQYIKDQGLYQGLP